MTRRDDELDEAIRGAKPDRPYIEKPDDLKVDVGGLCFLDRHRVCGPDCTAYADPTAPTALERCVVLSFAVDGLLLVEKLVRAPRRAVAPPNIEPPSPFGAKR